MKPAAKKIRRKDLRQPDEFFTVTGEVLDWVERNRRTVAILTGVVVALFALGAAIRWYVDARETRAARDFYAAEQLYDRDQWDVARDSFKTLAEKLGRTSYGRLAPLYAGHAALHGDHPGEAVTFYRQFIAAGPETDALAQIALLNLARALAATGDAAGARKELESAVGMSGPVKTEADFELATATQAAGERDKALELYQKFLGDHPDAPDRELARARVLELGGTPPAEPPQLGGVNPLQIMPMNDAAQ